MTRLGAALAVFVLFTVVDVAHGGTRMIFRDRFEGNDALERLETKGASLGLESPISLDGMRYYTGYTALAMGGEEHDLSVTHTMSDPGGVLGTSVYVFVGEHDRPDAFVEVGFEEGEPLRVGIGRDGRLLLEGSGVEDVPRVTFAPGWIELAVHRDGGRLRVFAPNVVVAQWDDPRAWSSVALVRSGSTAEYAWFDDFRIYTGAPHFLTRIADRESRRARRPRLGIRSGVAPVVDPSAVDPGAQLEVDVTFDVRHGSRLGVEGGFRSGSLLGDDDARADMWLFGVLFEQDVALRGFFVRGEVGFGRVSTTIPTDFAWYGAAIGIRLPIAPRFSLVPSIGFRRLETGEALTEIPVALTLRWTSMRPGSSVARDPS